MLKHKHAVAIEKAIKEDPRIVSTREKPLPLDLWYLEDLGLTESLLKRLETAGLAARAYRIEKRGELMPGGHWGNGGMRQYWVIFGDANGS